MPNAEQPRVTVDEGLACGFDDDWHERWWGQMAEGGGNVIAHYRMRMVESTDEHVVMSMDYQPGARQGTGVYASGIMMQLADVAATSVCFNHMRKNAPEGTTDLPFPLAVQISSNLLRNTDHGKIFAESRLTHGGRTMLVCDSTVKDEEGRLLATMTTTHLVPPRRG
jgi:uncharacterized protein (TIGR00369 family)